MHSRRNPNLLIKRKKPKPSRRRRKGRRERRRLRGAIRSDHPVAAVARLVVPVPALHLALKARRK